MDKLYEMELHESVGLKGKEFIDIRRVPGGWIYTNYMESQGNTYNLSSCFVPFDNEFRKGDTNE